MYFHIFFFFAVAFSEILPLFIPQIGIYYYNYNVQRFNEKLICTDYCIQRCACLHITQRRMYLFYNQTRHKVQYTYSFSIMTSMSRICSCVQTENKYIYMYNKYIIGTGAPRAVKFDEIYPCARVCCTVFSHDRIHKFINIYIPIILRINSLYTHTSVQLCAQILTDHLIIMDGR